MGQGKADGFRALDARGQPWADMAQGSGSLSSLPANLQHMLTLQSSTQSLQEEQGQHDVQLRRENQKSFA